ncbi:MAG: hypothetical protein QM786_10745 [Breznakibacter sp.]
MAKNLLIMLLVLSSVPLWGQENGQRVWVLTELNYAEKTSATGVFSNRVSTDGKYFDGGALLVWGLNGHFNLGVGLDYVHEKETRFGEVYVGDRLTSEQMDLKSHAWMPKMRAGYEHDVSGRLKMGASLLCRYGQLVTSSSSLIVNSQDVSNGESLEDNGTEVTVAGIDAKERMDYFNIRIAPDITYKLTERFGVNLSVGGIDYALMDWDGNNSSWTVNFNPSSWRLGVKIGF